MLRLFALLAVMILLVLAQPLQAGFPTIPPPLAQRVATADLVVLGKVTAVDDEPVQAYPLARSATTPKVAFQVTTVRVESVIVGAEKLDEVRVAFMAPPAPNKPRVTLRAGQAGCLFLRKHPEEPFHVVSTQWDLIDGTSKDFAKDLALIRRCARLLADPGPGLRSKDADERLLTAAVLVFHYRTVRYVYKGPPRTEPTDAEQSRLILKILGDGDLEPPDLDEPFTRLSLFLSMNLSARDGWVPPRALREIPDAARKWLDEHTESYRIPRFVPDKP
jgi:hypothetical protein